MDSWTAATLEIAMATCLVGVIAGRGWGYWRSSEARRRRAGKLTALQAHLDEAKLRASQLDAELHAQRARCFALERELDARESDWAQSSPTPFSFDAKTFQIERSLLADDAAPGQDADRIAALEQQVRDLQDLLSKVTSRPRTSRSRARTPSPSALVEEVVPHRTETAS
jgi:chromosome segregation ATPase